MNKYQGALNRIIDEYIPMHYEGKPMNRQTEDALLLQELVDKATPMKPTLKTNDLVCPTCDWLFCNRWEVETYHSHCSYCGQAIDWSEDD